MTRLLVLLGVVVLLLAGMAWRGWWLNFAILLAVAAVLARELRGDLETPGEQEVDGE